MNAMIKVTKEGFEALKKELSELVDEKRPKVVERLSRARGEGDLSENSDYINAKDELEFLDGRIEELQEVIKNAQVVKTNGGKKGLIGLGTKVVVKHNNAKLTFHIVGEWEADPVAKKISHTSPLGVALVGKKVGEKAEVDAPAGKVVYQILEVR